MGQHIKLLCLLFLDDALWKILPLKDVTTFWTECRTNFLECAKNYQMRNTMKGVYEHNNCAMYSSLELSEGDINFHCTVTKVMINLYSTASVNNKNIEMVAAMRHPGGGG